MMTINNALTSASLTRCLVYLVLIPRYSSSQTWGACFLDARAHLQLPQQIGPLQAQFMVFQGGYTALSFIMNSYSSRSRSAEISGVARSLRIVSQFFSEDLGYP
jgi:hypothetical protein